MGAPDTPRRGVATIADLRARSIVDPITHCWIWQAAKIKGSPRIWTLHLDDMEKRVLSGPRATWYIAHGTNLGSRVAYMACWNPACVCPVHVRACNSHSELNRLAGKGGVFKRSGAAFAANVANAAKARAAAGHRDTPPEVVQAVRQAAGPGTTQRAIARSLNLSNTVVSRILRGETHRHLLPASAGASLQRVASCAA
jgi:hypothetical protein